jgi:hypothetical protein
MGATVRALNLYSLWELSCPRTIEDGAAINI